MKTRNINRGSMKFAISFLILSLNFFAQLQAQTSGQQFRRTAILDGNNINTVFTNYGVLAQPSSVGPSLTWNGAFNSYFGDFSFMIGLQLPINDYTGNGIPDTIISVVTAPVDRPGGVSGWTFEPVDSFFNHQNSNPHQGVALSHIPESWPQYWPDHPEYGTNVWNGLFGPNTFAGTQESYFQLDDANDERLYLQYGFLPDSTNPSRKGHGLRVSIRYIQLHNSLYKDILYKIYDIKNESIHTYEKVVFGMLGGTYIGGGGPEWNDDVSLFYPKDNYVASFDFNKSIDPSANPDWSGKPGYAGHKLISAPNSDKITSFHYFVPSGDINLSDDNMLWNRLKPGTFLYPPSVLFDPDSVPYAIRGEDGDYLLGSGYFQLSQGETSRAVSVLTFGRTDSETLIKAKLGEALYHSDFDTISVKNKISLTSFPHFLTISGNFNISWNSQVPGGTIEIWYTRDDGVSWQNIVRNAPNTGQYIWNTGTVPDAAFSELMIFIKDNAGNIYGFNKSRRFRINNSGNGVPFVRVLNEDFYNSVVTQSLYDFELLTGDPEEDPLILKIYYTIGNDTNFTFSQSLTAYSDTTSREYTVDLNIIPNSDELILKFEVSDGVYVYADVTDKFRKQVPRNVLPGNNISILSGNSQAYYELRIIDETQFASSEYIISFNDTLYQNQKTFSVLNTRYGYYPVENEIIVPGSESSVFEGLTLYTEDFLTHPDPLRSSWNNVHPLNLDFIISRFEAPSLSVYGKREPFDYIISFSDTYNDSSDYLYKVFGNFAPPAKHNLNFRLYKIQDEEQSRIKFAFTEASLFRRDTLSFLDQITVSNYEGTDVSWRIVFAGDSTSNVPSAGDTLYIFTKKGFSIYDTLRVHGLIASNEEMKEPGLSYTLFQNYPNPFNPNTTISYSLEEPGLTEIKVFDLLGREVRTLVNEYKTAGHYKVNLNGAGFASGVYFYRIISGRFTESKKMILLK